MGRACNVHVSNIETINLSMDLTFDQKCEFTHEVMGPAMYEFGSGSYYSESEYCMANGQWQNRYWDPEIYSRLLQIKQTWDPEHVFSCRHCIGDEEMVLKIDEKTLPTWRYFDEL